ncbi:hypothetical protein CCONF_07640 [Corynebacterium confusum]|nr:hypothetical protein CCONF_07640 [Corynebacterium confusum]
MPGLYHQIDLERDRFSSHPAGATAPGTEQAE